MIAALVLLLVYALAAGALVDLIKNGSILQPYLEAWSVGRPWLDELRGCSFCLSYQAGLWLAVLCFLPAVVLHHAGWESGAIAWQAPAVFLATTRLSWLINGLLPERLRYDRS